MQATANALRCKKNAANFYGSSGAKFLRDRASRMHGEADAAAKQGGAIRERRKEGALARGEAEKTRALQMTMQKQQIDEAIRAQFANFGQQDSTADTLNTNQVNRIGKKVLTDADVAATANAWREEAVGNQQNFVDRRDQTQDDYLKENQDRAFGRTLKQLGI